MFARKFVCSQCVRVFAGAHVCVFDCMEVYAFLRARVCVGDYICVHARVCMYINICMHRRV